MRLSMLGEHRFSIEGYIPVLKVHGEPRPAPAVIVLHELGASAEVQRGELASLAAHGLTAVGVDAPHHGARRDGWLDELEPMEPPESHVRFLRLLQQAVPEVSRTIDHLVGEGHGPIGVAGVSMGAYIALAAATVEMRIKAAVSILGSPSWAPRRGPITDEMRELMRHAPIHRPADCARHPLLLFNAGRDVNVPPDLPGGSRDFARLIAERHPALASHFTYLEYAESEHFMRPDDWADLWRRTLAFLRAHLGG
jgi:alpha-beta hydrolase superfamily lysophospholipase